MISEEAFSSFLLDSGRFVVNFLASRQEKLAWAFAGKQTATVENVAHHRSAEGAPILFEYSGSIHVSQKLVRDVRPAYTWRFGGVAARAKAREWAGSIRSALRELGLEGERLAVDRLDAPGLLALQDENIAVTDVGPTLAVLLCGLLAVMVAPPLPALQVMSCPEGEMDLSCRQREW